MRPTRVFFDIETGGLDHQVHPIIQIAAIAAKLFVEFLERNATYKMKSKAGREYDVAELVGHNAATFDAPFLFSWFKQRNVFLPASYRVLDTMQLAMWYPWITRPKDFKLETLAKHLYLFEQGPAHDALSDVRMTVKLAKTLARTNYPSVRRVTSRALCRWSIRR